MRLANLTWAARIVARSLIRQPRVTLPVVVVAALALAATAALYTVASRLFLSPPEVDDPDRLVHLSLSSTDLSRLIVENRARLGELEAYFASNDTLVDQASVADERAFDVASPAETEWHIRSTFVSPRFAEVIGVRPIVGTSLVASTSGSSPRDVLIGYGLWTERFGRDPSVIGRVVEIPGSGREVDWRVQGVMPRGFSVPKGTNFWIASSTVRPPAIPTFARLAPGVSIERLRSDVRPVRATPFDAYALPANGPFLLYFGVAGFGLVLTAWLQVGSLLLTRTAERTVEFRVRSALGAGRADLAALVILESAFISAASLFAAWAMTSPIIGVVVRLLPDAGIIAQDLRVDSGSVVFASSLAVLGTAALSLASLGIVRRADPTLLVRVGGAASSTVAMSRARRVLLAVQVGCATALVYVCVLVGESYGRVFAVDLGFKPELLLGLPVPSPWRLSAQDSKLGLTETGRARTSEAIQRIRSLPEAASVASARGLPVQRFDCDPRVLVSSRDPAQAGTGALVCSAATSFFRTLGVSLVAGAEPTGAETAVLVESDRRAIVNQTLARHLERFGDVLGQTVPLTSSITARVVGIVPDLKLERPDEQNRPMMFLYTFPDVGSMVIARARSSGDVDELATAMLQIGGSVWGERAPRHVLRVTDAVSRATADYRGRSILILLVALGTVPLIFAGVAGAGAHTLAQRRQELAVRIALGLPPRSAVRHVLRDFAVTCSLSIAAGVALGMLAARWMGSILFGLTSAEPRAAIGVALLMAAGCAITMSLLLRRLGTWNVAQLLRGL